MRLKRVPISYGLPRNDEELWDARAKLFPNAKSYVLGGCCADLSTLESEQLVCDECRKAEKAWEKENGRDERSKFWHRDSDTSP